MHLCGKIIICMNTSSDFNIKKPSIIQALLAGFNTVANKPDLILIPIVLDLFLWFGPAWRVDRVFAPFIQRITNLPGIESVEVSSIFSDFQAVLVEIFANLNLAVTLRTLPIGVPSLMASKPSFLNPLGQPLTISLETYTQFLGFWLLFLVAGFFLGSLYFENISKQVIQPDTGTFKALIGSFLQIILMPILLLLVLVILSIPLVILITLVTMISPAISQFILLMALFFIVWSILPLIFTPHAIFLYKQNLMAAMITSIKVVRLTMSKTTWFILAALLLIEGLNYLWRSPNVDNWFLFIGIFGHAFIVSAVIAGSFHYFLDATKFSQSIINQSLKSA
jgi:hypothetical protein